MENFRLQADDFRVLAKGVPMPGWLRFVLGITACLAACIGSAFSAMVLAGHSPPVIYPLILVIGGAVISLVVFAWDYVVIGGRAVYEVVTFPFRSVWSLRGHRGPP